MTKPSSGIRRAGLRYSPRVSQRMFGLRDAKLFSNRAAALTKARLSISVLQGVWRMRDFTALGLSGRVAGPGRVLEAIHPAASEAPTLPSRTLVRLEPTFVKAYSRRAACLRSHIPTCAATSCSVSRKGAAHFYLKEYHKVVACASQTLKLLMVRRCQCSVMEALEAYDKGLALDKGNEECKRGREQVGLLQGLPRTACSSCSCAFSEHFAPWMVSTPSGRNL